MRGRAGKAEAARDTTMALERYLKTLDSAFRNRDGPSMARFLSANAGDIPFSKDFVPYLHQVRHDQYQLDFAQYRSQQTGQSVLSVCLSSFCHLSVSSLATFLLLVSHAGNMPLHCAHGVCLCCKDAKNFQVLCAGLKCTVHTYGIKRRYSVADYNCHYVQYTAV